VSDVVFTQEEARQLKAMLLQVQNAAIDLAQKNKALEAELASRATPSPSPSREGWQLSAENEDMVRQIEWCRAHFKKSLDYFDFDRVNKLCDMALHALRPAGDEGVRVAVKEALDYMVDNGSYTQTREGRIALRDGYLAALPAAPQGWRPIETAPKEIDPNILVSDGKEIWADWWSDDDEDWWNVVANDMPRPTHWMPLPAAPKSPREGA
jgi:hypothetical protein